MAERERWLGEQGASNTKETYLELIENCCGLEYDALLAVLNKCIQQLKNGCVESDNQSPEIQLQIAGISKLLTKKIYETKCNTYEIEVPVVDVECEPSVNCRFCDENFELSKLAEHQKQNCKSLTLGELNTAKLCSEYLYRIRVAVIECTLCGISCKTIADKILHDDSFGHLTRSTQINPKIFGTIYCSLCYESLPNNNVQCYEHIQCASHRRLLDPIVNWYQILVRYHSFLSFVRCITCEENLLSPEEVNEHHFTKHNKTKRQRSVCRVWCIFCDSCDIFDLTVHLKHCEKLSPFYCQLCNGTLRGSAAFMLHVKSCQGVSIQLNELDIDNEFSNLLISGNSAAQPVTDKNENKPKSVLPEFPNDGNTDEPTKNKLVDSSHPKLPTTHLFSVQFIWCNCCGDFCLDLRQHYQQSCRPVVANVLVAPKRPNIQSFLSITARGLICGLCNIYLKNLKQFRYHEKKTHTGKNIEQQNQNYSSSFMHCSVCYDYIPGDDMFYEHHIVSSDHKQLNRKEGWLNGYTYILLFFTYRCLVCKVNLFRHFDLIRHHRKSHPYESNATAWCHSCDTSVYLVDIEEHNELDSHKEWSLREMTCLLCHGSFTGYYTLLSHVRYCLEPSSEDHLDCSSTSSLLSYQSTPTPSVTSEKRSKKSTENLTSAQQKSLADLSNLNYTTTSSSQNSGTLLPAVNSSSPSSTQKASRSSPISSSGVNYALPSPISQTSSSKSLSVQPSTGNSPIVNYTTPAVQIINYPSTTSSSRSSVAPAPTAKSSSVNYSSSSSNNPVASLSSRNSVAVNSSSVSNVKGQTQAVNFPNASNATTSSSSKKSVAPGPATKSSNNNYVTLNCSVGSSSSVNSAAVNSSGFNHATPSISANYWAGLTSAINSPNVSCSTTSSSSISSPPTPTTNSSNLNQLPSISANYWASRTSAVSPPSACIAATSNSNSSAPTNSSSLNHATPVTSSSLGAGQTPASVISNDIAWFTRYPYQPTTANGTSASQATRNSPQVHSNRTTSPTNHTAPQPRAANPWASLPPVAPPTTRSKCLVM